MLTRADLPKLTAPIQSLRDTFARIYPIPSDARCLTLKKDESEAFSKDFQDCYLDLAPHLPDRCMADSVPPGVYKALMKRWDWTPRRLVHWACHPLARRRSRRPLRSWG